MSKSKKSEVRQSPSARPLGGAPSTPGMRDDEEEICLLPLGTQITVYIQHLVARDVAMWPANRPCNLTREEARAFGWFLHDTLPQRLRTPMSKRPRTGGWHGRAA